MQTAERAPPPVPSAQTAYSGVVPYREPNISVIAYKMDPAATITSTGGALDIGANNVSITVSADAEARTYLVGIFRRLPLTFFSLFSANITQCGALVAARCQSVTVDCRVAVQR